MGGMIFKGSDGFPEEGIYTYVYDDGHLGYSHDLANVNSTAMNTRCMYLFKLEVLLFQMWDHRILR